MILMLLVFYRIGHAQTFPIPGGPVASADTSCLPFTVSGIGTIYPPGWMPFTPFISQICIDITTPHPETLVIWVTSPAGTSLLLSAYNGAGGANYTNTCFVLGGSSIAGIPGPMTGNFSAQGPGRFSVFDWENANGTWHLCIADTLADTTYTGPGGPWGPTTVASGSMGFGTSAPPPPPWPIPQGQTATICQDESFDLFSVFNDPNWYYDFYFNGTLVTNPGAITAPGIYDVYATDLWWFYTDFAQFTLTVDPGPNLGPDITVNECSSTFTDLNNYFPLAGNTYTWYQGGSVITNTLVNTSGTYTVIAQNSYGCYDTASVTINFSTVLDIGPDTTIVGCDGFPFNLNQLLPISPPPSPSMVYTWYQGGIPLAGQPVVNNNGFFTLVGTDINGCADTLVATLSISQPIALGPDQNVDACSGSVLDLNNYFPLSGTTTTWSQGGLVISNSAASSIATSGTYQVIAQNSGGCSDTASITVNIFQGPDLGTDTTVTDCHNFPYDLSQLYNTGGMSTSSWYIGSIAVPNPSAVYTNGIYTLIVSDVNGCTDTVHVILTITPFQSLGPDQTIDICSGESIDLTTLYNTFGYNPVWLLNGNIIPLPTQVSQAGVYSLIISSGSSCYDTANVTLNVLSSPSLGPDVNTYFCSNSTIDISSLFTVTGLTTTWFHNGSVVSNPAAVNVAGNYMLVAVNSFGCADTAMLILTDSLAPDLGPDQLIDICVGDTADLTSIFNTSGLSSVWSLNGIPVAVPGAVITPGNYSVVVTDNNGCTDEALLNLVSNPLPLIGADKQIIVCEGTPVNLTSLYNVAAYASTWSSGGILVPDPANVSQSGSFTLTCITGTGCTDSAIVTIIHKPVPSIGNDMTDTICGGTFVDLNSYFPVSGLTTAWMLQNVPVTSPEATGVSGYYMLVASNPSGCSDTAFMNLVVNEGPDLGPDREIKLCPWMNIDLNTLLTPTGNLTYWNFNGQPLSNTAQVHEAGLYQAIVIDNQGCTDTLMAEILNIYCECNADFTSEGNCMEDPIRLTALADSAITSVHWTFSHPALPDQFNPDLSVFFPTYQPVSVTLEVQLTCGTVEVSKMIVVDDCSEKCPLYIPNAFSPNNDGVNDEFEAISACDPETYELQIRNRFGQLLFTSNQPGRSWDGKFSGVDSPEGNYVYTLRYKMPYQSQKVLHGSIVLLR
jgi:gliding motility-associated-like protein